MSFAPDSSRVVLTEVCFDRSDVPKNDLACNGTSSVVLVDDETLGEPDTAASPAKNAVARSYSFKFRQMSESFRFIS